MIDSPVLFICPERFGKHTIRERLARGQSRIIATRDNKASAQAYLERLIRNRDCSIRRPARRRFQQFCSNQGKSK